MKARSCAYSHVFSRHSSSSIHSSSPLAQVCCHPGLWAAAASVPRPLWLPPQVASDGAGSVTQQRGQPHHWGSAKKSSAAQGVCLPGCFRLKANCVKSEICVKKILKSTADWLWILFKDLLNDWELQRSRVQELHKTGSELESLIIDITAPQTKSGEQPFKFFQPAAEIYCWSFCKRPA